MAKISINSIKSEIETKGWQIISTEYKNLDSPLVFKCEEGHEVFGTWKKLRAKLECPICNANNFKIKTDKVLPKKGKIRIIGLDQATKITGYSVFDDRKLVYYNTYSTPDTLDTSARIHNLNMWLISMIQNWKPDMIGIEGIQLQDSVNGGESNYKMGVTTFEALARLQGVLIETCIQQKMPYIICPTNTWRSYCGVKGRTKSDKKHSMQLLTKEWYDISISNDEADAIGIGKYTCSQCAKPIGEMENWE